MHVRLWLVAIVLLGCGESREPAPAIEPAREPAGPAAPEHAVPAEPSILERDLPAAPPTTFVIPTEGALPPLATLPTRVVESRGALWEEVQHPDPIARRRLARAIEELAYESGGMPPGVSETSEDGGCRVRLATVRIVAVECRPLVWHRSGGPVAGGRRVAEHFAIRGSEVRPFSMSSALRDGRAWTDLVDVPHCVGELTPEMHISHAPRFCRGALPSAPVLLTATGVDLLLGDDLRISRSFRSAREVLREDGPIAWLFDAVDPPPASAIAGADGWAVGEAAPISEIAAQAAAWPADLRETVRVLELSPTIGEPVVPREAGLARARQIAAAWGREERRVSWGEARLLRLVRARARSAVTLLAGARTSRELRRVPAGTLFVAAAPAANGLGAEPERAHVATAPGQSGWVPAAALEPFEGCAPDAAPLVATIPEAERQDAIDHMTISLIDLGPRPATLFVTRAGARTHLRIEARGESCAPGEVIFAHATQGQVFHVELGATAPEGDPVLVIALLRRGDDRVYEAYHVPSGRRVLTEVIDPENGSPDEYGQLFEVRFQYEYQDERAALAIRWRLYDWDGTSYTPHPRRR